MAEGFQYDVFVSYAHVDATWVTDLAGNLERLGLRVWLDRWELVPGQLVATRLQEGLARAASVVAVVSRRWVESGWCGEEFAAAVAGAATKGRPLIPVVLGEVELPEFIASRYYLDFRHVVAQDEYETLLRQLCRAVGGAPAARRPTVGEPLVMPGSVTYRPDGPSYAELRVGVTAVVLNSRSSEATCAPLTADQGLDQQLWALRRARARADGGLATRRTPAREGGEAPGGVAGALVAVGRALGERFAYGEVADALAREAGMARTRHTPLRIGVSVDDPRWVDLPWETLMVPGVGQPLALAEHVQLYRKVRRESAPPAVPVPGPLRILAVVASPESGGGELLDYELELAQILDAVSSARSGQGGAYVRVLNWGSLAEIRAALEQERFHVLHLSCHARAGELLLEDERGRATSVDARRFMREALPSGRGIPFVVLAGCSTARTPEEQAEKQPDERSDEQSAEQPQGRARAGLARELLECGVPAVLAMTESVTDPYATRLTAKMYEVLARAEHPDPLTALSEARREVEVWRRGLPDHHPLAGLPEWATPALFLAGPPLPLFDRAQAADQVPGVPEAVLDEGMVVRKVGEFVGRRAELRRLLRTLRDDGQAGVLVHGIGGVGKSTLAAELLHHYGVKGRLVVPVGAATVRGVDQVLEVFRQRLGAYCVAEGLREDDALRRVVVALTDARVPWRERWGLIRQIVLPRVTVVMVLDNAEDLLERVGQGWELSDSELAELLVAWTGASPRTRLLVTSRYPFALPQRAQRRLVAHHLGPLSYAETRKLIWRLPGLDALAPADQRRAYADVGGHPRALEYLDALLRGGRARFPDVAERMEAALEGMGVADPERWLEGVEGDLDTALAETVTLAVDDVLLDTLLEQVDEVPGARRLLDGLAVYRVPVDRTGVAWQLSDLTATPEGDPVLLEQISAAKTRLDNVRQSGAGPEDMNALLSEVAPGVVGALVQLQQPPVGMDGPAENSLRRLLELGLVSPAPAPQDKPGSRPSGFAVHRWTADALQQRARADELAAAHARAAAYWLWRFNVLDQSPADDITQLIEARHHHRHADDLDQADITTQHVCLQLHTWGSWDWEQHLIEETLTWFPARSAATARYVLQLGHIAEARGDYDLAEEHCRASLAIKEELGDQDGIANCYHELGLVAQGRGDYDQAEKHYRRTLTIKEELDDRGGVAICHHQLGVLAQGRGDYDQAEEYCRATLAIQKELDDRGGIADCYGQLGLIAQGRGDFDQAEEHYRSALAIKRELGDRHGIANCRHQLGVTAQRRAQYDHAEEHYRASLAINENLGDRSGIASSYGQLGTLRTMQGRLEEGVRYSLRTLMLELQIGKPLDASLYWLSRQRSLLGDAAFQSLLDDDAPADIVAAIMQATAADRDTPPSP
ncbi:MAG: tetratricopeptide repeat protein [Nonomuraea sp.]|nr:tetratricopeptide repeat protein [Nonomuraea sp.]